MANNEKALKELLNLAYDAVYNSAWLTIDEYMDEGGKIIYNQISSKNVKYFNDGTSAGAYNTILSLCIKAVKGNQKAQERLLIDLEIKKPNLTIKKIE